VNVIRVNSKLMSVLKSIQVKSTGEWSYKFKLVLNMDYILGAVVQHTNSNFNF